MAKQEMKRFWASIMLTSCVLGANAGNPGSSDAFNSTRMNYLLPEPPNTWIDTSSAYGFLNTGINKTTGIPSDKIKVSGVSRFLSIYRSMNESYSDMINSDKNFSFSDYPQANIGGSALGGYPVLELNLQSKLKDNVTFSVGYSMSHNFTGALRDGKAQNLSTIQNLNFRGTMRNDMVVTTVYAGEVLATSLSRFTMGQPLYRDNYFERLPWDWYRNSFTRYQEYFTLSSDIGGQFLGRSPLQGFVTEIQWLPMQINFKAVAGRTNFSNLQSQIGRFFPALTHGYRLEKVIFERYARGYIGANFYQRLAKTDFVGGVSDNNTIGSINLDLKIKKVKVIGEFGVGKVSNPQVQQYANNGVGTGGSLKLEFDQRSVENPFSVEFYQIGQNLASVDGSIINSNHAVKQGGAANDLNWDATLFTNVSNEVGQITNNRRGVNLQIEAALLDNLKAQFGYSASQELQANHDTITIQHRVNSFSRSRFRPWFQAGGPYGRVKSVWFRTFETITLGNDFHSARDAEGNRDLLGFNAVEMLLKSKFKIAGKELVLLNFSSLNTISSNFSFAPALGNNNLIALWYNDFTAAYQVKSNINLVANFAVQGIKGSDKVNLSSDNGVDEFDPSLAKKRVIDNIGTMTAVGIDYDFNKYSGIHLRTKYMTHKDKNFVNDRFSGFETTLELKIFF
ncbi:MAG: hypothetical protein RLZZ414_1171 [Bacteroidota bacterium]|jgi:hypothetical protein